MIKFTDLTDENAEISIELKSGPYVLPLPSSVKRTIKGYIFQEIIKDLCSTIGIDDIPSICDDCLDDKDDDKEPVPDVEASPIKTTDDLTFTDDFSGTSLEVADAFTDYGLTPPKYIDAFRKWGVRHLQGNSDQAMKKFTGNKTHILGFDGGLHLLASVNKGEFNGQEFDYVGGMISTELSFAQEFGTWEIDFEAVKVGKGHQFSAWLVPVDGSWPPEIDIFELAGNQSALHMNFHEAPGVTHLKTYYDDLKQRRTVSVTWTPDAIIWLSRTGPQDEWEELHRVNYQARGEMYLILSWEVGTDWVGDPDEDTAWPADILIHEIRVKAYKDPAKEIELPAIAATVTEKCRAIDDEIIL